MAEATGVPSDPYGGHGSPGTPERALGIPAAALAMVGWAASGVIAKGLSELGPLAVVFWRMWLYTGLVLLFLWANGTPLKWSSIKISAWGGFSLAFDIMLFFTALRLTTVANATVVASLQPLLMLYLAPKLFGEQPRGRHWGIVMIASGGIAIVVFGSSGIPEWSLLGDLLAALTLFAWTGYFVFSKLSTRKISSAQYTGGSALVCSLVCSPFAIGSGQVFDIPSPGAWVWLVILSIGPGFASHMLMNWSLARIPAWVGSTMTLAIPVTSTLMAWAFLGDEVSLWQFVGMTVVMFSLAVVVVDQSRGARA
ncbi:DMT family transporter [Candidatus Poriferisodalis sp.]|uniref:DMT family transporter n=1 Tax=Candidatus Poriferisodalis sp. TaxID=3101277 RepID=UPI003AF4DBEC